MGNPLENPLDFCGDHLWPTPPRHQAMSYRGVNPFDPFTFAFDPFAANF